VNDAIAGRIWPHLARGHADAWMSMIYADEEETEPEAAE